MNGAAPSHRAFPIEDFVQSLTAQLDRAQDALALKVRTGRPLTFAIKDLSIDLQVFWEADPSGRVLVRHAGPNEEGASTVHLAFTTITRSMVEENTISLGLDEDPRGLEELAGRDFDEQDRHRLEMVGVRTVGQLRRLSHGTDPRSVERFAGVGVERLRAALQQASRPTVTGVEPVRRGNRNLLRVRGVNFKSDDPTEVLLSGEPVEVLEANDHELLVRPMGHHHEGQLEVLVAGETAKGFYELPPVRDDGDSPATIGPAAEPLTTVISGQDNGADLGVYGDGQ